MRKAFRHTGVLMMAAVVALGLLGAAYTLWWERLTLEANITTGTFDIDWSCHDLWGTTDTGDCAKAARPVVSLDQGVNWLGPRDAARETGLPLDVIEAKMPTCSAVPGDRNPGTDNGGQETLSLTLHGLYPYAGCEFWLDIHNAGTVPAHVKASLAVAPKDSTQYPGLGLLSLDDVSVVSVSENCPVFEPPAPGAPPQLVVDASGKPLQLHAGAELACRFIVYLDQKDTEAQGVHLTLDLFWYQWNEDTAPIPGQ